MAAPILAVTELATAVVVTVKVAVFDPAGTVTVAGTVALELFELRFTICPPVGAATFRVTVPVEEFPPTTLVGDSETELTFAEAIEIVWASVVEPIVAVSWEFDPAAADELVDTVKVVFTEPAGTTTDAGTVATEVVPDDSVTVVPPVGAAAEMVTVPVEDCPAFTVVGEIVKAVSVGPFALGICNLQSPRP